MSTISVLNYRDSYSLMGGVMRKIKRTMLFAGLGATLLSVGAMNSAVASMESTKTQLTSMMDAWTASLKA